MQKILATAASLTLLAASATSQAMVTFSGFEDDDSPLRYDVSASTDNGDGPLTIAVNDFLVDENSAVPVALDTFTFTIDAEPGFFITSIDSFEEAVTFESNDPTGVLVATGTIAVSANGNNDTRSLGTKIFNGITGVTIETLMTTPFMWDIADQVTSVTVSITNSLTAVGTDLSVEKGDATVTVSTAFVPLPASFWLLMSGVGLAFARGRKNAV